MHLYLSPKHLLLGELVFDPIKAYKIYILANFL